jgi:hypothetical protein
MTSDNNRTAAKSESKPKSARSAPLKPNNVGILQQLPASLQYLVGPALKANSLPPENLEDHPELAHELKTSLDRKTRGMSKHEAKARIEADWALLSTWLKSHPVDRYPETTGLHWALGALAYANRILD